MNSPAKSPKKPKQDISGWINLDKPAGLSSTQAMAKVRWLLNAAKAGHGGTLDPFATGVLPIALGDATKLIPFILNGNKSYRFHARWGEERATDDLTGEIIATSPLRPSGAAIEAVLPQFRGPISQLPPRFSAIHVDGQRAYDLARAGKEVILQPRTVTITRLELIDVLSPDEAVFEADCTKGTYIRALARDIGAKLGCHAHVNVLKRLKSGPFGHETTISLERLAEIGQNNASLLPLTAALDDIPALIVNEQEARRLRQGQNVVMHPSRITPALQGAGIIGIKDSYGLVALAELSEGSLQPFRVFKPQLNGVHDVA